MGENVNPYLPIGALAPGSASLVLLDGPRTRLEGPEARPLRGVAGGAVDDLDRVAHRDAP